MLGARFAARRHGRPPALTERLVIEERNGTERAMTPLERSVTVVGRFVNRQQLVSDEVIEQRLGVD